MLFFLKNKLLIYYFYFINNNNIGKGRDPCCRDHKLSVFFGGEDTENLKGIKSSSIENWLKNATSFRFTHIRKNTEWG